MENDMEDALITQITFSNQASLYYIVSTVEKSYIYKLNVPKDLRFDQIDCLDLKKQ